MIKAAIIMDPILSINIKKDSSFSMLLEMQHRKYEIFYIEIQDLFLLNGEAYAYSKKLIKIDKNKKEIYIFSKIYEIALKNFDFVLMRKDPPFNMQYIYSTYILERAEIHNTLIINKPQSLRDCNEKIFASWFSNLIPNTLVTKNIKKINEFCKKNKEVIFKPLDKMGGQSIFRLKKNDPNMNVVIETLTKHGKNFCMIQKYIPEISKGDKRILIINGNAIPYCLNRIPRKNETRGNITAGAAYKAKPLTKKDFAIVNSIKSTLIEKGLFFVGLDIIGDKLTEINVTSPTCIQEIEKKYTNISITKILFDEIENKINKKNKFKY